LPVVRSRASQQLLEAEARPLLVDQLGRPERQLGLCVHVRPLQLGREVRSHPAESEREAESPVFWVLLQVRWRELHRVVLAHGEPRQREASHHFVSGQVYQLRLGPAGLLEDRAEQLAAQVPQRGLLPARRVWRGVWGPAEEQPGQLAEQAGLRLGPGCLDGAGLGLRDERDFFGDQRVAQQLEFEGVESVRAAAEGEEVCDQFFGPDQL